jgi:selT/selW/selH-like putative selenoprotein
VELRPGDRGAFEVSVAGRRIFSKLASGRFPDLEEILPHLG